MYCFSGLWLRLRLRPAPEKIKFHFRLAGQKTLFRPARVPRGSSERGGGGRHSGSGKRAAQCRASFMKRAATGVVEMHAALHQSDVAACLLQRRLARLVALDWSRRSRREDGRARRDAPTRRPVSQVRRRTNTRTRLLDSSLAKRRLQKRRLSGGFPVKGCDG